MGVYKFIKIKGPEGASSGYFAPHLYQLLCSYSVLKTFGLQYVKARLNGWTIWWVENEGDYARVIKTLDELKKTRIFDYVVCDTL
jgi:hypothetical protein